MSKESIGSIFVSVFIGLIVWSLLSTSLSSLAMDSIMRDGSIINGTRYTITNDALSTISEDDSVSVIGTGSSQVFKALDGKCVSGNLNNSALVYNIAQPSSRAYTDMLHIPRIVAANPEIVLIEIAPNLLGNTSKSSEEYIEMRFKLDTMNQDNSDLGGWVDIIDPEHRSWVALDEIERMNFRQEYFPEAIEERLSRLILEENNAKEDGTYGWIPQTSSATWVDYLQTPIFPGDKYGFDGKSIAERESYNDTLMKKTGNYNPSYRNSQAHTALDYQISTLLENNIQVILVSPPHHPKALSYVIEGKWDGLHETLNKYELWPGVTIFDQTWESGWTDDHFYDRNHLDDEGRIEFCKRLAPVVDILLN